MTTAHAVSRGRSGRSFAFQKFAFDMPRSRQKSAVGAPCFMLPNERHDLHFRKPLALHFRLLLHGPSLPLSNYIAGSHHSKPPLWSQSQITDPVVDRRIPGVQLLQQDNAEWHDVKGGPNPAHLTSASVISTPIWPAHWTSRGRGRLRTHRLRLNVWLTMKMAEFPSSQSPVYAAKV